MSLFGQSQDWILEEIHYSLAANKAAGQSFFQLPGFAIIALGTESRIGRILLPSFEHLKTSEPHGPIYEWHLADLSEAGGNAFFAPEPTQYGTFISNKSTSITFEHRGPVLTAFEPHLKRFSTLALEGHLVSSDQSAKPLLRFLFGIAEEHGWFLVHAAAIGFKGSGLLTPGAGGMGKSTLSAAATIAGADFAGDDFVAVKKIDGGWHAHSLFSTIMLFAEQAQRFSGLVKTSSRDGIDNSRKTQIRVRDADGMKPVRSLRIDSIAIPQIVDNALSKIVPGSSGATARAILPFSAILAPPARSVQHAQALMDLAAETEPLVYQSGSDFQSLAVPLRQRFSGLE